MRALALLSVLALAAGCEDNPTPVEAILGGLTVRVEPRPARLVILAPDGRPLLEGLPGGRAPDDADRPPHVAAALRRSQATYEHAMGAFRITERAEAWQGVAAFGDARLEDGALRFDLIGARGARLGRAVVAAAGEGELTVTLEADDPTLERVSLAFACAPGEHFLGLGGQSFDVDHRGQTVPLWVQEDGITKVDTDSYNVGAWVLQGRRHSTHTPMPITLSSRGYALLLDTPGRSIFALCSEDEAVARVEAWEPRLALRLFHASTPAGVVERLTARLGRPALPPAFAFAPWLDAIFGSANVRRVADRLRAEDVPAAVIWTEDYRGGEDRSLGYELDEDWGIDRDLYPDFEALADDLHARGFKLLTYANTFLVHDADVTPEAVAAGHAIRDGAGGPYWFTGVKFTDTTLLDLSSPAAVAWAKAKLRAVLEAGSDGHMADFAEWLPTDAVLASGESAVRRHNLYPVDWARLNRELLDEAEAADGVERLFFVRAAYLGSQPLVSVVWAGDQQTDFSLGDGLPSVIPIGLGLGVTGFPFFGHDIGGYMSQMTSPTSRELFFRWTSLGALSPVMRTHHGRAARENWSWETDAETIAHFRRWAKLHTRLFPYLYAMAREGAERGLPMMRPVALGYPDFEPGWTATDVYLLGDRILVAPVVEEGAVRRSVALPPGSWFPLEGGPAVAAPAAGGAVEIDAPLGECPAFVPAGTVLALYPEEVDTVVAATAPGVVTAESIGDDRELWLWPGGEGRLEEVSGLGYAWRAAALAGAPTSATWNGAPVAVTAGVVEVTGPGTLAFDGGTATLIVTGGDAARRLVVRVR